MRNSFENMSSLLRDPQFLATLIAADNALLIANRSLNSTIFKLEPIMSSSRLDESLNNTTFIKST